MTRAIAAFCLSRLFLEPFLVAGHGLARAAAAKEMRSLPSFDAFRLKTRNVTPVIRTVPGVYSHNPGYSAGKSHQSSKTGTYLASFMGSAMAPGFSPGRCRAGGSSP